MTGTAPDDLQPGDHITWIPAPGGVAVVEHILVPNDKTPTSRVVTFTFGGRVDCNTADRFTLTDADELVVAGPEDWDHAPGGVTP